MAGTEEGVKEPRATFSACFGAAFIMMHPTKYAAMLAEKMQKHGATGWLVNTGWSGGRYVWHCYDTNKLRIVSQNFAIHSPGIKSLNVYGVFQLWFRKPYQVSIHKENH